MKLKSFISLSLFAFFGINSGICQDTFSIVAVDSATGEVGSAGASCVDLANFPGFSDDFLGELFPGIGAINSQAYYIQANQINARNRMNLGETPNQIIQWLVGNDVNNQPELRQYGIAALINDSAETAAHTGASTDNYKGHITGKNYAIQGNILLGPEILDSMEYNFLNTEGDLSCKLMAALQGANVVAADSRCIFNGTSSLFAFLKVAQPSDTFGNPSFLLSVRTSNGDMIEPIDSLQRMFDSTGINCNQVLNIKSLMVSGSLNIFPNPIDNELNIALESDEPLNLEISDLTGHKWHEETAIKKRQVDVSNLRNGIYFIRIWNDHIYEVQKFIKN